MLLMKLVLQGTFFIESLNFNEMIGTNLFTFSERFIIIFSS